MSVDKQQALSKPLLTARTVQLNPDLEIRVAELEAAVEALGDDRCWLVAVLAEVIFELEDYR